METETHEALTSRQKALRRGHEAFTSGQMVLTRSCKTPTYHFDLPMGCLKLVRLKTNFLVTISPDKFILDNLYLILSYLSVANVCLYDRSELSAIHEYSVCYLVHLLWV